MSAARIAMVAACPFPSPQGSQVFVEQMSQRLVARGHEVHLFTYGQGREVSDRGFVHHRIRRLPGDDATRSGPRPAKPLLDAMLTRALVHVLGQLRFDVVHCHNYEAAVVGAVARTWRGVPVVYHSHNLMGDELSTYFSTRATKRVASSFGSLMDRTVPRSSDHVIALCDYSAGVLRRAGVASERLSVIPPAIDDEGAARTAREARRALGLAETGGAWVGYCGNLDAYQSLDVLLAGFARLQDRDARLLIATHRVDPSLGAALREHGLGARAHVLELATWSRARAAMEACDVLVLPRRHGSGWPIKLLNYLSLGRTVVAAGCGAKVLVDGQDGLLCPDDDAQALADAIDRALASESLRRALGGAARARFLREFTWDAVLPAIERIYTRCAAEKALPRSGMHVNVGGRNP